MDDEQKLIKRLREGDSDALEAVIKLHHGFLVAMAIPLVGPESAHDVAQETWLRALAAINKFEGRAKLRTWLARIAINEAHAMRRKRGREVPLESWSDDASSPISQRFNEQGAWETPPCQWHHESPEALLTETELHACIHKHLRLLPGNQQLVVLMRELGGLDYDEIAQALGLTEGNIRVLLHRGRQQMQVMLNHFQEEGTC